MAALWVREAREILKIHFRSNSNLDEGGAHIGILIFKTTSPPAAQTIKNITGCVRG